MLSIIGCSKDKNIVDDTAQFELDKQLIRNYLRINKKNEINIYNIPHTTADIRVPV